MLDRDSATLPAAAQTHLSDCSDCTRFFDDARALDGKLSQNYSPSAPAPEVALPSGFHDRVLAAARASEVESKVVSFPRWWMPAAGAAAAAVVALLVWQSQPSPDEVATSAPVPAPEQPAPKLPTGFESPIDVPAMTAVAGRGLESAFGEKADTIASDIEKIRGFFTSRVTVVSRIGL